MIKLWTTSEGSLYSYLVEYWEISDYVEDTEYWHSVMYWLQSAELFLLPTDIELIKLSWPLAYEGVRLEFVEAYVETKRAASAAPFAPT